MNEITHVMDSSLSLFFSAVYAKKDKSFQIWHETIIGVRKVCHTEEF